MVIRRSNMRSGFVAALLVLAGCRTAPPVAMCDLNEIAKPLGSYGWNVARAELIEKPITPVLIPCSCEIDPFLASIGDRDPVADAHASLASGSPHYVSLPTLGGALFFEDSDPHDAPDLPSRRIPGPDEHAECYERERLEQFAKDYASAYNDTLSRLMRSRSPP